MNQQNDKPFHFYNVFHLRNTPEPSQCRALRRRPGAGASTRRDPERTRAEGCPGAHARACHQGEPMPGSRPRRLVAPATTWYRGNDSSPVLTAGRATWLPGKSAGPHEQSEGATASRLPELWSGPQVGGPPGPSVRQGVQPVKPNTPHRKGSSTPRAAHASGRRERSETSPGLPCIHVPTGDAIPRHIHRSGA